MIEGIAEAMGVGRLPLGLRRSLTPPASAVVAAVSGQPLELVRPLMESLESDVLPRDPEEAARHLRHPPAPLRARGRARARRVGVAASRWARGEGRARRRIDAPPQERLRRGDGPAAAGGLGHDPRPPRGRPARALKKGSKLTQCLKLAGRRFKVRWTVVENEPCEQVVWEGRGPVARTRRVDYEFEPNGDGTGFRTQPVRPSRRTARPPGRARRRACHPKEWTGRCRS